LLLVDFPKREIETLWAPWRFEYFDKAHSRDFLSEAARASDDAAHLVLARRKNSFLLMNRYPYAVGHLMAVPYRKVGQLGELGENEVTELFSLVVDAQQLLRSAMKAQGFNIGINVGECAGAGVPDHLHIHVVPRWSGDTNFMPMLTGTRVLSESLESVYRKLLAAQQEISSKGP
jgi:ATP adenylyltransferase